VSDALSMGPRLISRGRTISELVDHPSGKVVRQLARVLGVRRSRTYSCSSFVTLIVAWSYDNQVTTRMMLEHLRQEIDYFLWGDTFVMEPEYQSTATGDSRHCQSNVHQLHFIHHSQAFLTWQSEFHRPTCTGTGVATIERAGEKHVLYADQDGWTLRFQIPAVGILAAHRSR